MQRLSASAALAIALLLVPSTDAFACRYYRPPHARISRAFDAIILARIETATPKGTGWQATAQRTAGLYGLRVEQQIFEISRSGDSAMCDDGQAIAKVGEIWALYLTKQKDGAYHVRESYPRDIAAALDPRLRP